MPNRAYLAICAHDVSGDFPSQSEVKLLGLPPTQISWITTPHIHAGQCVLVVLSESEPTKAKALYIFDHNNRPFQVGGIRDLLLDGVRLIDLTKTHLPTLRYAKVIQEAVFASLSLGEMCAYQQPLRLWQAKCIEEMLSEKPTFKSCQDICLKHWNQDVFAEDVTQRATEAVMNVKQPKKSERNAALPINLNGYRFMFQIGQPEPH